MAETITARHDPELSARVVHERAMTYAEGPSETDDRPPHVRAASGLSAFKEYLAVIQDDANWLALIDADDEVHALPLPGSPQSGRRVFSAAEGNKHEKFDLEACVTVPGGHGPELIGFGSGSHRGREWILRVHESEEMAAPLSERAAHDRLGVELTTEFLDARPFYDNLRETTEFAGPGLNIEGAVPLGETIRLFQRGNAPPRGGLAPVDATGDVAWRDLVAHLADPHGTAPPPVTNIRQYELGALDGVRLTFSDAEPLEDGRVLFSASAEDPETDAIVGSTIGVIDADGAARWTEVRDLEGGRFAGKIEGLSRHPGHPDMVHFVIDDDDETAPSMIYQARLGEGLLRAA